MPQTETVNNASPSTPANVALPPEVSSFYPAGFSNLFNVKYVAAANRPTPQAILSIADDIQRLSVPNLSISLTGFRIYSSHYPFALHVPPASLGAGFYNSSKVCKAATRLITPARRCSRTTLHRSGTSAERRYNPWLRPYRNPISFKIIPNTR